MISRKRILQKFQSSLENHNPDTENANKDSERVLVKSSTNNIIIPNCMDKKINRSVLVNLDLGNSKVPFKILDEDRWFYDLDIFKKRNDYT